MLVLCSIKTSAFALTRFFQNLLSIDCQSPALDRNGCELEGLQKFFKSTFGTVEALSLFMGTAWAYWVKKSVTNKALVIPWESGSNDKKCILSAVDHGLWFDAMEWPFEARSSKPLTYMFDVLVYVSHIGPVEHFSLSWQMQLASFTSFNWGQIEKYFLCLFYCSQSTISDWDWGLNILPQTFTLPKALIVVKVSSICSSVASMGTSFTTIASDSSNSTTFLVVTFLDLEFFLST